VSHLDVGKKEIAEPLKIGKLLIMSRTEVIEAVNAMDREDRAFFEAYIKAKNLSERSDYAEESSRRLVSMKNGDFIDSVSLKEIHTSLEKKGI